MLEASQSSGIIKNIPTVKKLMQNLVTEYSSALNKLTAAD